MTDIIEDLKRRQARKSTSEAKGTKYKRARPRGESGLGMSAAMLRARFGNGA